MYGATTKTFCAVLLIAGLPLLAVSCSGSNSTPTSPSPSPTPTPAPAPAPTPAPAPAPSPTPAPAPSTPAALSALTASPTTVPGQGKPTGTITLTAAAPGGGAVVTMESNNSDVVKVPSSVTVAAGQTTATFTIDTGSVTATHAIVITARYLGEARAATVTVTPPLARAVVAVSGPRGANACTLTNQATQLDCQFNGSGSEGLIARYTWNYTVGNNRLTEVRADAVLSPEVNGCGFLDGASTGTDTAGAKYIEMQLTLQVTDREDKSNTSAQHPVRLYPDHLCGLAF